MDKMWQRPLRDGRLETYVSAGGHFLHVWADSSVTNDLLRRFEEHTGVGLPTHVERKPALHGRRRRSPDQLTIDDVLAAA